MCLCARVKIKKDPAQMNAYAFVLHIRQHMYMVCRHSNDIVCAYAVPLTLCDNNN